jgi:hypothetical protein
MPAQFIQYKLDDGTEILIMAPEGYEPLAPTKAAAPIGEENVFQSKKRFSEAMDAVKQAGLSVLEKLHDLQADEVELKFGLVTTGELGNFAVGKVGIEANYEVTLKWQKKPDDDLHQRIEIIRARRLNRRKAG